MKKFALSVFVSFAIATQLAAQQKNLQAPEGFDVIKNGIAHGKIDSLNYSSSTVGTQRKVLVYTPPGYDKKKKYPVLYLLHGIGGDEKEWLREGTPQIILDNLYADKKVEPMIVV